MHIDAAHAHANYNRWMNDNLYALAADLSAEQRDRDLGAFFSSLSGTLHHILVADRIWLARFEGVTPTQDATLEQNFDKLREARKAEDERIIRFADALTESAMTGPLSYANSRGERFEHPLWYAVDHCFNHQTHHRGQATTLLMQLGKDPGVTDLIAFLRLPTSVALFQKS